MNSNMPDPGTHHDYGRVTDQMYAQQEEPDEQSRKRKRNRRSSRPVKHKGAIRQILELLFGLFVIFVLYGLFF